MWFSVIDAAHLSPSVYAALNQRYPLYTSHNFSESSWGYRDGGPLAIDFDMFYKSMIHRVPDPGSRATLWIDAEGPYMTHDDEVVEDLLRLAEFIATQRPLSTVGFYNPVHVASHSDQVRFVDTRITHAPYTSVIGPRCYDAYRDRAQVHQDAQLEYVERSIELTRASAANGMEVMAFISHRYAGGDDNGETMPHEEFRTTIQKAIAYADGLVWFGTSLEDDEALDYGNVILDVITGDA